MRTRPVIPTKPARKRAQQRNVTMIPRRGSRVVRRRLA
jgi:hypothetical protein